MPEPRARIFLSSSQTQGSPEDDAIRRLGELLHAKLGFDVTLGLNRTVAHGVPEDIRRRLDRSEYFILVDFDLSAQKERNEKRLWNRSLFAHQEFAIAVYLGLDYLVFFEAGLEEPDGVWKYVVKEKAGTFTRKSLERTVLAAVKARTLLSEPDRRWNASWRRELAISRALTGTHNPKWIQYGDPSRKKSAKYFLVEVTNHHRDLAATDVHAYLERVVDRSTGVSRRLNSLPLKWNALVTESTSIPPKTTTGFSGVLMFRDEPGIAYVGRNPFLVDTNTYDEEYRIRPEGSYDLHFAVFSREFAPARARLVLKLGRGPRETTLSDPAFASEPRDVVPNRYQTLGDDPTTVTRTATAPTLDFEPISPWKVSPP
jgi:hypothetical protein